MVKSRSGTTTQTAAFSRLLHAGTVPQSRRDFMRASAIVAAATASGLRGVSAAAMPSENPRATSKQQDVESDVQIAMPFNPYGQEVTIDPHRTVNWGPFWVMLPYAWSGLLRFDENGAVEPDLAESVEPNEDGTVWTATLREGVAFANGDPVVAEHFVTSWMRALDRTMLSPMASFMEPVEGFDAYVSGESSTLGFNAVDERTIEITLAEPLAHFPSYLATFVWAVMNPAYIDQAGDEDAIPLSAASAGPWKIDSFDDASSIEMSPNEHYWGEPSPSITGISWRILPSGGTDQAALDLYGQDEVVVADVPVTLLPTVQEDETLATELVQLEDHSSTLAISLDFHQPPFDDVRVRRAIAATIDRERWANEFQQNAYMPATSFTPPVLAMIANYQAPAGPDLSSADPARLLEEAEVDPATVEAELLYFQPATDTPEQMEAAAQLLAMIEEGTGLVITHDTSLTREQITALRQDNGGLAFDLVQWWLASNTPSLLATVASQESEHNAGWINWEPDLENTGDFTPGEDATAFDELVNEASGELDEAARNELYSQAEALLLENHVYIPLGYWVQRFLQKPWFQGTRQGPWSGNIPVRIDGSVTVSGRSAGD